MDYQDHQEATYTHQEQLIWATRLWGDIISWVQGNVAQRTSEDEGTRGPMALGRAQVDEEQPQGLVPYKPVITAHVSGALVSVRG